MEKRTRKKPRPKTAAIRIETDGSNITEVHPAAKDIQVRIGQQPKRKGLWTTMDADTIALGTDD